MHVLITTDTAGGVWTYTRELASGLALRGNRVTLASFGPSPTADQISWLESMPDVRYIPTTFRLEWMQNSAEDIACSREWLSRLIRRVQPDVIHLNQYAYGDLETDAPKLVVAHSDVVSWWVAVHREEPPESPWMRWYRDLVLRGLSHADAVVTPSEWMLGAVKCHYTWPERCAVIHNGRDPRFFSDNGATKEDFVLCVGRLWDQGKQVSLLTRNPQSVPVYVAGPNCPPDVSSSAQFPANSNLHVLGACSQEELRNWYNRASTYAAPSRYEPFGLAPLEAALSRCALIANDIPVFHELWGDAAFYFKTNDADSLASAIRCLSSNPELRHCYAQRAYERARLTFSRERMLDQYQELYRSLLEGGGLSKWTN